MAEHAWSVFCSRLVTDKETNQVSLIDIVESLTAVGPEQMRREAMGGETVAVRFIGSLVSLWVRSNLDTTEIAKCRAMLFDGSGKELLPYQSFDVDLSERRRLRTQFKLEALPLRGEGQYAFQVELLDGRGEWQIVSRVPFEVRVEVKAEGEEEGARKPRQKHSAEAVGRPRKRKSKR